MFPSSVAGFIGFLCQFVEISLSHLKYPTQDKGHICFKWSKCYVIECKTSNSLLGVLSNTLMTGKESFGYECCYLLFPQDKDQTCRPFSSKSLQGTKYVHNAQLNCKMLHSIRFCQEGNWKF